MTIPISFSQAFHMAQGSYEMGSKCGKYLLENCPNLEVLAQESIKNNGWLKRISGSWRVVIYRIKDTDRVWVSIQGTDSFRNVIGDVSHQFSDHHLLKPLVRKIHKFIENSIAGKNLKLEGLSSHSAGGLFNRKLKEWFYGDSVWNIAFNSQKPGRDLSSMTVNLQAINDKIVKPTIVTSRTIKIEAVEGHKLKEFGKLKDKTWEEIHPSLKGAESIEKPLLTFEPSTSTEVKAVSSESQLSVQNAQVTESKTVQVTQRVIANGVGTGLGLYVVEKWVVHKDNEHQTENIIIRVSSISSSVITIFTNLYKEHSLALSFMSAFIAPVVSGSVARYVTSRVSVARNEIPQIEQPEYRDDVDWDGYLATIQKVLGTGNVVFLAIKRGLYHLTFQPCDDYYKKNGNMLGLGAYRAYLGGCEFCYHRFGYYNPPLFHTGPETTLRLWARKWFGYSFK